MEATRRIARRRGACALFAFALLGTAHIAAAEEIKLRTSCGGDLPPACFETIDDVLAEIHERPGNGRTPPGPTHPVVVDIGAGIFDLADTTYPYCDGLSNLSFRGAGKDASILTGGGYPFQPGIIDTGAPYAVLISECSDLDFSHLQIRTKPGVSKSALRFVGSGSTWWSSVRILAGQPTDVAGVIWIDSDPDSEDFSMHHWTDVQATVTGRNPSGIWLQGSRHEIRASHIKVVSAANGAAAAIYGAIYGTRDFDLNVEGSMIEMQDASTAANDVAAVWFTTGAGFYGSCDGLRTSISGSQIRVASSSGLNRLQAIRSHCATSSPDQIRGQGNTYVFDGGAIQQRLFGDPMNAPLAIGSGSNPPSVATSWSQKGQDTFVETDCGASCQDTPQGSQSHTLVFDPGCATAGPWFDATAGACRGL